MKRLNKLTLNIQARSSYSFCYVINDVNELQFNVESLETKQEQVSTEHTERTNKKYDRPINRNKTAQAKKIVCLDWIDRVRALRHG